MSGLISRAQWNARAPRSTVKLNWGDVVYFVIHYSGAKRSQSVRSIQDYCMDKKNPKHADIDYNELIRDGKVYAGRMDNAGGHTLGLNSKSYGVCIIGVDGDANELDLTALQARYRYACDRAGRMLTIVGHKYAPGQKPTSCPGSEILSWINAGLIDDTPAPAEPGQGWTEDIMTGLPVARLGHHSRKTVKTIQGLLNRDAGDDHVSLLLEDGVWGPRTDARVRDWQVRHQVPNSVRKDGTGDGVFGPASWKYALDLD